VDECWCGVWDGYGYESDAPRLALPDRPLLLYHGSPLALGDQSPTYWWPDDRAWIVASEIDFDYTCIGGSRALIDLVEAGAHP
jgi:hypothetical protein